MCKKVEVLQGVTIQAVPSSAQVYLTGRAVAPASSCFPAQHSPNPCKMAALLVLHALQTVEALLHQAGVGEADKLAAAAQQWGQQQGLSVRSAATFARRCRL